MEFRRSNVWSKQKIAQLASQIGLKKSQIYKWNWDMLRKLRSDPEQTVRKHSDCGSVDEILSEASKVYVS